MKQRGKVKNLIENLIQMNENTSINMTTSICGGDILI